MSMDKKPKKKVKRGPMQDGRGPHGPRGRRGGGPRDGSGPNPDCPKKKGKK